MYSYLGKFLPQYLLHEMGEKLHLPGMLTIGIPNYTVPGSSLF